MPARSDTSQLSRSTGGVSYWPTSSAIADPSGSRGSSGTWRSCGASGTPTPNRSTRVATARSTLQRDAGKPKARVLPETSRYGCETARNAARVWASGRATGRASDAARAPGLTVSRASAYSPLAAAHAAARVWRPGAEADDRRQAVFSRPQHGIAQWAGRVGGALSPCRSSVRFANLHGPAHPFGDG